MSQIIGGTKQFKQILESELLYFSTSDYWRIDYWGSYQYSFYTSISKTLYAPIILQSPLIFSSVFVIIIIYDERAVNTNKS